jgi:hypothetical protein
MLYMYDCMMMYVCVYIRMYVFTHMQGGLAGMSSWALVYPLDSIKTRIQVMAILLCVYISHQSMCVCVCVEYLSIYTHMGQGRQS